MVPPIAAIWTGGRVRGWDWKRTCHPVNKYWPACDPSSSTWHRRLFRLEAFVVMWTTSGCWVARSSETYTTTLLSENWMGTGSSGVRFTKTAARSFITVQRRNKVPSTPRAANSTASSRSVSPESPSYPQIPRTSHYFRTGCQPSRTVTAVLPLARESIQAGEPLGYDHIRCW